MGIIERREREKQQRKEEIIIAAEKVFSELGFEDSTMIDIAEKAELSKGTLYLYFNSKEELHFEVGLIALEKITNFISERIDENQSGLKNLRAGLEAYLEFGEKFPTYYNAILAFESSNFDKVSAKDKTRIFADGSPLYLLRDMILQCIEDGSLRNDINPIEMVILLWSQLTGIQQFIRNRTKVIEFLDIKPDELLNKQLDILINGMRK